MNKSLALLALLMGTSFSLSGCKSRSLPVANNDTVVTLGSAATVKVFAFGDLKISFPSTLGLKLAAADPLAPNSPPMTLLAAEFRRDSLARTIEAGTTYADYAWEALGRDPERYLRFSSERSEMTEEDVNYADGSGFVVTSDGSIVTCQHCVIGGPVPSYLNKPLYEGFLKALVSQTQGLASDAVMAKSAGRVFQYLASVVRTESVFKEARVLVPQVPRDFNGYDSLGGNETDNPLLKSLVPSSSTLIRKWTWPAIITASGQTWPGKDVAVLKIFANNLFTIGVSEGPAPRPDSTVLCLGFPGKAVQEGNMTKAARFRVILHAGKVGQTLPTTSGFDAIHTDADINHGDSGGPDLNEAGEVIGLSVSGQEDAPGQNYLIPASVIRERMAEAGLKSKVDDLNAQWKEGLLLLQAKQYAEAKSIFEAMRMKQDKNFSDDPNSKQFAGQNQTLPNPINFYLDRAIKDCATGLKAK